MCDPVQIVQGEPPYLTGFMERMQTAAARNAASMFPATTNETMDRPSREANPQNSPRSPA